jgi:excinuclease UvrABC nuclease subunit
MTGLYRVYDGADGLLYIGVSKHFGVRWQQHAQKRPWWNERRRMTVDFYDDREEALDAEALAIFNEQPKYNVLHRKQAQRLKRLQQPEVTSKRRATALAVAQLCPDRQPQELTQAERGAAARVMSLRTNAAALSEMVESRECLSCRAKPGDLCRTASGKLAYYHQGRWIGISRQLMPGGLTGRVA